MTSSPIPDYVERLPDNYEWFSDQIAGHHPTVYRDGKREIGILKKQGSKKVLKVAQDGKRGIREVSIYRFIKGDKGRDAEDEVTNPKKFWSQAKEEDRLALSDFVPEYHGQQRLLVDGAEHDFMKFTDVTMNYKKPAILDVKMGQRTYDPAASETKKAKESAKYPPQSSLGFRILGYRIHRDGEVTVRGKKWGMEFDEKTVADGLREFFHGGRQDRKEEMLADVTGQVQRVRDFFDRQRSFHFYASSLLFLYETDETLPPSPKVYMIDFSHAFPANGTPDENYIPGIENLLHRLKQL